MTCQFETLTFTTYPTNSSQNGTQMSSKIRSTMELIFSIGIHPYAFSAIRKHSSILSLPYKSRMMDIV